MAIYRRANSKFWWYSVWRGPGVPRVCGSTGKVDRTEALAVEAVMRQAHAGKTTRDRLIKMVDLLVGGSEVAGLPLAGVWDVYHGWQERAGKTLSPVTCRQRRRVCARFAQWAQENWTSVRFAGAVDRACADGYSGYLASSDVSMKTRRNVIADLGAVWEGLRRVRDDVVVNPWPLVLPSASVSGSLRLEAFSQEEESRVLVAADAAGHGWGLACRIARHTGLRYGDVARMKWEDVDLVKRVITVVPTNSSGSSVTHFALVALLAVSCCPLLADDEQALKEKLPVIFAKAVEHYKALDAAATPLMKDSKGNVRTPHGFLRWKTGKDALDMPSIFWWTSGHFAGSLWYLYEATGDAAFRDAALKWTKILEPVKNYDGNHDTGFMMYCSYGNARRILKTDEFDAILLKTADSLSRRYCERLGLIRSWGAITNMSEFLVIPDNMMNLELLEFAAKAKGGDSRFGEIARSHADKSMANHFRDDGGCYHVLNYDQREDFLGSVQEIRRGQGLSCRTAWSRGQSWGIYGYTMMYRETKDPAYLAFARKIADFAINHPNMPADGIPLWDYGARPDEERDSSAASCMASALLELSQHAGPDDSRRYRAFAVRQLLTLSSPAYFSEGDEIGHFLLKHGVGHKPGKSEIDTSLNYGDYYFLEALLRFRRLKELEAACAPVERLGLLEFLDPLVELRGLLHPHFPSGVTTAQRKIV